MIAREDRLLSDCVFRNNFLFCTTTSQIPSFKSTADWWVQISNKIGRRSEFIPSLDDFQVKKSCVDGARLQQVESC